MNLTIFFIALLFGITETAYFGWNMFPGSPEEVICDGIAMVLLAMSFMWQKSA